MVVAYRGAPVGQQLRDLEKCADILAVVLNKAGVSLGWMYLAMGVIIGSTVLPIAFHASQEESKCVWRYSWHSYRVYSRSDHLDIGYKHRVWAGEP